MDETRQTFLDELYAHGRAHDEQREDRLQRLRNVEPETAELLGVLVRAMNATRVLEIGTSNGYSTISSTRLAFMARTRTPSSSAVSGSTLRRRWRRSSRCSSWARPCA